LIQGAQNGHECEELCSERATTFVLPAICWQPKVRPSSESLRKLTPHGVDAAFRASERNESRRTCKDDPLGEFYQNLLARRMEPPMARLTLARKIAAIALKIWKKGDRGLH
jgi:hypothetical protein